MDKNIFSVILALIPFIAAIITGFLVPLIKSKISSTQFELIIKWVGKAVDAAEVLFNIPDEKREYVINFIDKMFNSKKEVITEEQIRVLLEAACKEMKASKENNVAKKQINDKQ